MTQLKPSACHAPGCNFMLWSQRRAAFCNRRVMTFANIQVRKIEYFLLENAA